MIRLFGVVTLLLLLAARAYAQNTDIVIARAHRAAEDRRRAGRRGLEAGDAAAGRRVGFVQPASRRQDAGRLSDGRRAIAYDDRNIYFAFHCFDNEPDKIRTTISRRDSAFNDDWIAMSLDSAGTGQTAYHLFVNPSGSQMDALNTSASGEQFDADLVWYSVAKITDDGYVVEMQVPLQTLRFSGGDNVRMGILFFRKISRIGVSYSWPEMPPGQWVFDRPAHLLFNNLNRSRR